MQNIIRVVEPKNMDKMRIDVDELIQLYNEDKVIFVDVRMGFETAVWGMNFGVKIPANELPDNLDKLSKEKLIVVACRKIDRSIMARTYLASVGFECRYLIDGVNGLVDKLKGEKSKEIKL